MLASITPLGERGRGRRWGRTVGAYLVASVVGGAALGAVAGGIGGLLGGAPLVGVAVVAGVAAVADLFVARLPGPRRQVDERWLVRYRGWVYAAGFGAQLGV